MKFGFIGGDLRYRYLKQMLEAEGHETAAYCCKFIEESNELEKVLDGCHAVLGPIPCSRSGKTLALNDCNEIELSCFFEKMDKKSLFFAGAVSNSVREAAGDIVVYDYFALEDVAIKNAVPTAEGAVLTAISESKQTIFGSNALVIGCGRCGKALALLLKGMGANVTATCRKPEDGAYLNTLGLESLHISKLKDKIGAYSLIFNTVPAEILGKDMLENADKNSMIIDIAQAPGGTDFIAAAELGIKAFHCPGLPGRTAPYTAAEILKDAVLRLTLSHFDQN